MSTAIKISVAAFGIIVLFGSFIWFQLQPPKPGIVPEQFGTIANVTVIEPGFPRIQNQTVVIDKGMIVDVRNATESERTEAVRFVLPGLIDMHVHQPLTLGGLPDYLALLYLRHGVTSVRYTGHSNTGSEVERHRSRIEAGDLPGPRVFSCGPMIDGIPPLWPSSIVLTDPNEAEQTVSGLATDGVDCIKVYNNLQANVLEAVVRSADQYNLRVVGHVPAGVSLEDSGIDDVQHLIGFPEKSSTSRTGNPMADGWSTLSAERIAEVVEHSRSQGVVHTPTLVFLWTNSIRDRHEELIEKTSADLLPRLFRDVGWQPQESIRLGGRRTKEMQESLRTSFKRAIEVVGILHSKGVTIQAGTDSANPFVVQGAALLQEISLLTQAGLSNEDALAAATTVPGAMLTSSSLGRIKSGAPADLLVLSADPIVDLNALNAVDTVVAAGRFYSIDFLEREVSRYQQHHQNFTWDKLLPIVAGLTR